jgi:two-component system, sporulation sensor kinase E
MGNSIDAVDVAGKIEVCTMLQGNQIVVEIRDNGAGIPNNLLAKIGTPFFYDQRNGEIGRASCRERV